MTERGYEGSLTNAKRVTKLPFTEREKVSRSRICF